MKDNSILNWLINLRIDAPGRPENFISITWNKRDHILTTARLCIWGSRDTNQLLLLPGEGRDEVPGPLVTRKCHQFLSNLDLLDISGYLGFDGFVRPFPLDSNGKTLELKLQRKHRSWFLSSF